MRTLPLLLLLACAPADAPLDDDTDDTDVVPPLPVAHCGMDPYEVVVDDRLGAPTGWSIRSDFDLAAPALDALVGLAGFEELTPVPNGVRLFRFGYETQDRGELVEATGLIAVPAHLAEDPTEPWPVALLLHGFAGAADACAPSDDALIGPALPALLAANGFVAIAPDYIGMKGEGDPSTAPHAPLVGEQMAFGAWDAVRAARTLLAGELRPHVQGEVRDDLVIWGASQGGHGALWADLTAPYLAPEEEIVAVVAATPAHDLRAVVEAALSEWTDATALSALAFVGMRRWYAQPDSLHDIITNEPPYFLADNVEPALTDLGDDCVVEAEVEADEVSDIYTDAFVSAVTEGRWEDVDPWGCFLDENGLSRTSVARVETHPTLAVYGERDTLVDPVLQEQDFARLCEEGWTLQALQCDEAGHAEATLWALPEQLAFLRAHLDGEGSTPACTWAPPTTCSATPENDDG